ncbi:MAG: hypothetical protein HYY96_15320 [Candidatus Tectomicrobia bacterium]|nr:hypothetical protein [Candidatus Tectomicrobia bacterium]
MQTVEQELKEVGHKAGAAVVGIVAANAFDDLVPEGHRPRDLLPGCASVIVAGGVGPSAGQWRSPDNETIEIVGYDLRENVAAHVIADYIERVHGYYAIQAPSLSLEGWNPPMSMMLPAELAGLGNRSLAAQIILNPEYGLLYYAALLTTMPLTPDAPLDAEEYACPSKGCAQMFRKTGTTPCLRACPDCLDGEIDANGRIVWSSYNREVCSTRAQNYSPQAFQKMLLQIIEEEDPMRRKMMIYSEFFTRAISAVGFYKESIGQCFECMRVCPVGRVQRMKK